MKIRTVLALIAAAFVPLYVVAKDVDAWHLWEHELSQSCPNRHVEWVADGGYLDLLDAFEKSLPQELQVAVRKAAHLEDRCASEQIGFSCEMAWSLDAYRRLGLLSRFTQWGCKEVKCEEAALCSKFPGR